MPRYIDANALLARYKERCAGCKETKNYCEHCCDLADVISDIEDAPTVDAVEVVRCKDCIFSKNPPYRGTAKVNDYIKFCCQGEEPFLTHDEWFCASGMRDNVMEEKTDAKTN